LIFLNILEGGNKMDVNINKLPDNIKNYLNELNFNKKQTSLFLLGTLIGDIGSRQIKYGNKPVLNKINFQGMGIDRIMILFNEIYEKLIQEKMLNTEKETIYSIAHGIFDREKNNWDLKPHENVYYCLAGYSYKTYVNIKLKTIEQESKKYDTN
jgi:CRISPR-associated protein Csh1